MGNIDSLFKLVTIKYPGVYDSYEQELKGQFEDVVPLIRESLTRSLQDKDPMDIELLGYNVQNLTDDHGMNLVAAHLTLGWILREPDKALDSLKRGHDKVV